MEVDYWDGKRRLVTLDWDDGKLEYPELCYHRLRALCSSPGVECRVYKTRHGYHIYILLPREVGVWGRIALRSYLCDDPDRLAIDIDKASIGFYGPVGTLFQATRKGKIGLESPIDIRDFSIEYL